MPHLQLEPSNLVFAHIICCRYEERLKYIQTIVQRKMKSSFEEFTQNVMHPLESHSPSGTVRVSIRNQTPELEPLPLPQLRQTGSGTHSLPSSAEGTSYAETIDKGGHSPRLSQLRRTNMLLDTWSPPLRRPRANTNEDRRHNHSKLGVYIPLCFIYTYC